MSIRKEKIEIYDMTCTSCEHTIERNVKKLNGIRYVKANYTEQCAEIEYDDALCDLSQIKAAIKATGYSTEYSNPFKFIGILVIAAAVILLGLNTAGFDMETKITNASYAILFVVGILTSIHCVGMCGGILLSQSLSTYSNNKFEAVKPSLLYNLGRVISYTALGGLIGALGSVISLSIMVKSALQIFAGLFMITMGLNMLGLTAFRKIHIRLPHSLCKIKNKSSSPLLVGLFNGLMPCGPLQTMQLYALGTGSAIKGALSMFMFSVGTVPLMLVFGALSGLLSKNYTKKMLKFSGILIIVLGLMMGNRGFALAGINLNPMAVLADNNNISNPNSEKAILKNGVQVIKMTADNRGYTPNAFYVQKDIPVKWIIDGQQLNSCNNAIVSRALNLQTKIEKGENIIEFTPGNEDINFSCWMGMIRGVIKVVDNLSAVDTSKPDPSLPPASTGPSCCAVPIDEGSNSTAYNKPSIYGNDLTKVPTELLINKAESSKEYLTAKFDGIVYELQPLILVTGNHLTTKITFDLTAFDNAEGEYLIIDGTTGGIITSFTGVKGLNEIEFPAGQSGTYGIIKGSQILGLIDVVDDLETTNLEIVREKYFK
ncbi:MAG: heavy metal transport/detoxification protein [Epulopiscium sp.]|nr:heavy metal transport/detoxification protein [Candidatus Epulonipiscium sp.]